VRRVDPDIKIGASAYSEFDGVSDAAESVARMDQHLGTGDPWNRTLTAVAGDAFDYFVLHPYNLPSFLSGGPVTLPPLIDHLDLAEGLRKTVRDLRTLDPTKDVAVTEFGDLLFGGGILGVLLAALMVRVALEERLLMTVRHILVEDNRDEPFANAAAIFVPGPEIAPTYTAMRLMAGTLAGGVLPATTGNERVQAFATLGDDGQNAAVVAVRSHLIEPPGIPRAVDMTLPPGQWDGEVFTLGAPSLLASGARVSLDQARFGPTTGVMRLPGVPANALVIVRLRRV
jgi:hypothetical protein